MQGVENRIFSPGNMTYSQSFVLTNLKSSPKMIKCVVVYKSNLLEIVKCAHEFPEWGEVNRC